MRLEQFKTGDKVTDNSTGINWDIRYIGAHFVVLLSQFGEERVSSRTSEDYRRYCPKPTYEELSAENKRLRTIGLDLYMSIRDAAWVEIDFRTAVEKPNLSGPTPHMKMALDNWAEEMKRV